MTAGPIRWKRLKLYLNPATAPDFWLRRLIMILFLGSGALFLWTPTRLWLRSFNRFQIFRDSTRPFAGKMEAQTPVPEPDAAVAPVPPPAAMPNAPRPTVFRLTAPGAKEVFLGGTFNNFEARSNPLARAGDGVWEAVVPLKPGQYLYKFKVDGQWQLDPANGQKQGGSKAASIIDVK